MKLWIIYKEKIGFSMIIAEMLQDRLEDYIDVDLGNAKKIDPTFLFEEKLDFLILGDTINKANQNIEIQNWLIKYLAISNKNNFSVKAISGFYVALTDISVQPSWVKFLQDNVKVEIIYPPILRIKLNLADLSLENRTPELVKEYSNGFIEFIINKKK